MLMNSKVLGCIEEGWSSAPVYPVLIPILKGNPSLFHFLGLGWKRFLSDLIIFLQPYNFETRLQVLNLLLHRAPWLGPISHIWGLTGDQLNGGLPLRVPFTPPVVTEFQLKPQL